MQQRIFPGRGRGGRRRTRSSGTAALSPVSLSSAGRSRSKSSMMPCMVSCGVWFFFTAAEISTTPRAVSSPGNISPPNAVWNNTSFTNVSRPLRPLLGVQPCVETAHVDHHALMRAVADFLDFVARADLEPDVPAVDLGDLGVGGHLMADRRRRQMADIDAGRPSGDRRRR